MKMPLVVVVLGCVACAHTEASPLISSAPVVYVERTTEPVVVAHHTKRKRLKKKQRKKPRKSLGVRVGRTAERLLKGKGKLARNDCSGLVITAYRANGVEVSGGTKHMWKKAKREGRTRTRPRVGDIAFFDYTWDSNKNGRVDDVLTHVAIVTRVRGDQVEMVHKIPSGIRLLRANLRDPSTYKKKGEVRNDFLRSPRYGPKKGGRRMAGQLLRGFAAP